MPAVPPPSGSESPRAKQLQYYGQLIARMFPGVYTGASKEYYGQTWEQIFYAVAAKAPKTPVQAIASKIAGLAAVQSVANGVGGTLTQTGNFTNEAAVSANGLHVPGFSSVLDFLNSLGDPHLWLRIAEGILGIILIATAVSHATGAGSALGKAARKVPLVV